ncbi:MAG: DNA/RNA non-specific endonuclease [Acidobacteria bacterium]|nr:DNA/RNA non-specific endonuclease [Acidobacteriota bacterium]
MFQTTDISSVSTLLLLTFLTTCPATLAERDAFTVCYDSQNQRALWTSHTPAPSNPPAERKHWRKDHELNSLPSAAFTNTGFDRGHLTPVADLPNSKDTFLTSNAIAQNRALNRGQWRQLENQIRNQHAAHVVTGAVYNNCGNERIEAPCYIYKIAYLPNGQILLHFAENAPPRP